MRSTPELPLEPAQAEALRRRPVGIRATLDDIVVALREMPPVMRRLWWMKLFQWYGMLCYWIYIVPSLASTLFSNAGDPATGLREAGLMNGKIGGFYNFVAFLSAFALMPTARRWGARNAHAVCLALAGAGMWCIPSIHQTAWLFLPMIGIGLAWASMMGNPYILLAGAIPPERAGIYMGIFNMFIVLPMIIQMLTVPLYFHALLGGDPSNVVRLAGACLLAAAVATCFIHPAKRPTASPSAAEA